MLKLPSVLPKAAERIAWSMISSIARDSSQGVTSTKSCQPAVVGKPTESYRVGCILLLESVRRGSRLLALVAGFLSAFGSGGCHCLNFKVGFIMVGAKQRVG